MWKRGNNLDRNPNEHQVSLTGRTRHYLMYSNNTTSYKRTVRQKYIKNNDLHHSSHHVRSNTFYIYLLIITTTEISYFLGIQRPITYISI